jgi:hypothetical protein
MSSEMVKNHLSLPVLVTYSRNKSRKKGKNSISCVHFAGKQKYCKAEHEWFLYFCTFQWNFLEGTERGKRIEEDKKNKEFSGHYVCLAARLQPHPGSARTSLGPIFRVQLSP